MTATRLIVGLGNPGPKYRRTRHNVGYWTLDAIAEGHGIRIGKTTAEAVWGSGVVGPHAVILAQPLLYMNRSGVVVAALLRKHRLSPDHLLVIHDDFELDVGRIRIKTEGGHGGHNGIRSILESLGTAAFIRVKIGIGKPAGEDPSDYVLARVPEEERLLLVERARDIASVMPLILDGRVDLARNRLTQGWTSESRDSDKGSSLDE